MAASMEGKQQPLGLLTCRRFPHDLSPLYLLHWGQHISLPQY